MAMTRNELMEAFREATSCEFENIPAEKDIPYEFSSGFEKRMAKLIKKEKSA